MSDSAVRDTPSLGRAWCPGCDPDADPLRQILIEQWCHRHGQEWGGVDDERVTEGVAAVTCGTGTDADGAQCRSAAELLRAASI